jgi:hypothetical protein
MGLSADLIELCNDRATWNRLVSRNSYGEPTFTLVHADYPTRLIRENKLLRNKDQQQITSTAQAWILPSLTSGDPFPAIKDNDQVVLSDGSTPQIAQIKIFEDELGPSHTVVYFL